MSNPFDVLAARLDNIEALLVDIKHGNHNPVITPLGSDIGGIEVAERITGLARQTLYGLVSKRQIPHQKRGKKLYFSAKKLEQWIADGERPTVSETYAKTGASLATKKR